jgi:CRISPR-associated protein Cmr1
MTMIQHRYRLTFLTPAFFGNAEQTGQWRTPPIKALLRQWWRVVYAAQVGGSTSVEAMREAEGRLFGHAWLEGDRDHCGNPVPARRSEVRLRLTDWKLGTLKTWEGLEQRPVDHDEVERAGKKIGPHVYLGYGPLSLEGRATVISKGRGAIREGDSGTLLLAAPDHESPRLIQALGMISQFGALGGRSRNGWGSLNLVSVDGTPVLPEEFDPSVLRAWDELIGYEWPLAIGRDKVGPLIWQTESFQDWKVVMRRLAEIKIGLRTQFRFPNRQPDGQVHDRHWLSYPITNHKVNGWESKGLRLPNSLRFKVRPDADGRLRGVVFHMPCLPPPAFKPDRRVVESIWQRVHAHLDASAGIQRIAA